MYNSWNGNHGRQVDTATTNGFRECEKLSISRAAKKAGVGGISRNDTLISSNTDGKSSFIKVVDISNLNSLLLANCLVSLKPVLYILRLVCIHVIPIYGMLLAYKVFWMLT